MAASQSVENQPRSYKVFEKKHYIECTTQSIGSAVRRAPDTDHAPHTIRRERRWEKGDDFRLVKVLEGCLHGKARAEASEKSTAMTYGGGSGMSYVKPMPWMLMAVVAVLLLGASPHQADAQVACCRITSGGAPIGGGESFRCNLNPAQTRKLNTGHYEVDFLISNVRQFAKLATIDSQGAAVSFGEISVADRIGDTSSVDVHTRALNNVPADRGFNLCLF
jgi:hypothetical protein